MNQVSSYYMPGKYNIIYELYQEIDFGITSITSFVRSIEKYNTILSTTMILKISFLWAICRLKFEANFKE
jgi:hypothetical protein